MDTKSQRSEFETEGFTFFRGVVDSTSLARIKTAATVLQDSSGPSAGVRNVLARSKEIRDVADSDPIKAVARSVLGTSARIVRSILFDKSEKSNWDVVWHQDITISVHEKIELPGYGPWSIKLGVHHVRPPPHVLLSMATLRVHVDDCGPENGPLLVVPRSHNRLIGVDQIDATACERQAVCCEARAGDVLVMRPLLLHASKRAEKPTHRRVLHLEFSAEGLDGGLEWTHS